MSHSWTKPFSFSWTIAAVFLLLRLPSEPLGRKKTLNPKNRRFFFVLSDFGIDVAILPRATRSVLERAPESSFQARFKLKHEASATRLSSLA